MPGNNLKYQRSGLKEKDSRFILEAVVEYMEHEKPFLDPECSIHSVAHVLNISRHYISQVLNQKLNKNFYKFINEYRVEEFKRRAAEPEFSNYSIIALAFESGFNSKASFNMVFKKLERRTPSEYIRNVNGKKR